MYPQNSCRGGVGGYGFEGEAKDLREDYSKLGEHYQQI